MSDQSNLIGPKIVLMGMSGTGKTHSLGKLAEWCEANGHEMAVLFTENSTETLLGYFRDQGKEPPPSLFWHQQFTKAIGLQSLMTAANDAGTLSYELLSKKIDNTRNQNNAFGGILQSCFDFKDDRTGRSLGPVDAFPLNRVFVIDSATELANAAMKMVIGNKPTASMPDYMVAQNNYMNFLRLCTQGMNCPFVLTAHIDRITDPVTQATKIMIKSIGSAIASEIPTLFSEVIYTVREGANFYWDTAAYGVDTKTRSLGYASKIAPDFGLIMNKWKLRSGK